MIIWLRSAKSFVKMLLASLRGFSNTRLVLLIVISDVVAPMTISPQSRVYHASKRSGFYSSPNLASNQYPKTPNQYSNYPRTEFPNVRTISEIPPTFRTRNPNVKPESGLIRTLRDSPTGTLIYTNHDYGVFDPGQLDFRRSHPGPFPEPARTQLPPPLEATKLLPPLPSKERNHLQVATTEATKFDQSTTAKPSRIKSIKLELMSSQESVMRNARKTSKNTEEEITDRPKILEIQLPLKIATKDDLVAWARYVMSLMASKINITLSTVKDAPIKNDKSDRVESVGNSYADDVSLRSSSLSSRFTNEFSNLNFPGPRRQSTLLQRQENPLETFSPPKSFDRGRSPSSNNGFNSFLGNSAIRINNGLGNLLQTNSALEAPTGNYLPVTPNDGVSYSQAPMVGYYYNGILQNNTRSLAESTTRRSPTLTEESDELAAIRLKNLMQSVVKNQSNLTPVLSLPFEAVITITRERTTEPSTKSNREEFVSLPIRDPPDEFPPYFDKNFTLTNEFGRINVVLEDTSPEPKSSKKKNAKLEDDDRLDAELENSIEDDEENDDDGKRNEKSREKSGKSKSGKSKKRKKGDKGEAQRGDSSKKRQTSTLGELLMRLNLGGRKTKNSTENVSAAFPVVKETGPQKVQLLPDHHTELAAGNTGIDLSLLVKNVVSGALAGTSAGLSGASAKHGGYGTATHYGTGGTSYGTTYGTSGTKYGDQSPAPTGYGSYGQVGGSYGVPANHVNPVHLIGTSIKDILGAGLTVASSLVTAITGILGASSGPKSYGPPGYGAPPSYHQPYSPPPVNSPYQNAPPLKPPPQRQTRPVTFNKGKE